MSQPVGSQYRASNEHFDVIVIGAGSAGAPLAYRLAAGSARRVLLLEAGPTYDDVKEIPSELLWADTLEAAAEGSFARETFWLNLTKTSRGAIVRGSVLGGSGAINAGYFVRGARADFDSWERQGLAAWSYEKVLESFRRSETDREYGNQPYHGKNGPVVVSRDPESLEHPLAESFLDAALLKGHRLVDDHNAPDAAGVGLVPRNVVGGRRVSPGMAYVLMQRRPGGLEVRGNTRAVRLLIENGAGPWHGHRLAG